MPSISFHYSTGFVSDEAKDVGQTTTQPPLSAILGDRMDFLVAKKGRQQVSTGNNGKKTTHPVIVGGSQFVGPPVLLKNYGSNCWPLFFCSSPGSSCTEEMNR